MSGLLAGKTALIYGGGGAIGGATARVFAREGARVFLAGRTAHKLEAVVRDIRAAGGEAHSFELDVLDATAVNEHANWVASQTGRIDIMFNAVGVAHVQGQTFAETTIGEYEGPISQTARVQFITAQAVARHMSARRSGVILLLTTPGGRLAGKGFLSNGVFSAATEAFSRLLAAELGSDGIRVVCLCPNAIPETLETSGVREVFEGVSRRRGASVQDMLEQHARAASLLGRLPLLTEVSEFAAFVASDRAGAMTGAVVNLTCGVLTD